MNQVKTIRAAQWCPNPRDPVTGKSTGGHWRIPYTDDTLTELRQRFQGTLALDAELQRLLREHELAEARKSQAAATTHAIKIEGDAQFPDYEFTTTPYRHQRAGMAFLQANDAAALLWEMGTGKTKANIDDLTYRKQRGESMGGLIFCPNEVKGVWARQVPQHSGGRLKAEIIDGPMPRRRKRLTESDADVLILNVESLHYLRDDLLKREWPFVIIDEATRIKNPQAKRTKTALELRAKLRRILTGTPITNTPTDLWAPFSFLDPSLFGVFWRFRDRYCVMGGYEGREVVAFRNLEELGTKIQPLSYRVLKEQVLDLPPKTYHDLEVQLNGATLAKYEEMRDELKAWWEKESGETVESKARIALVQLLRLAQIAGGLIQQGDSWAWIPESPKLKALEGILEDTLYPGQKAVVFAIYRHEIESLRDHFSKRYVTSVINGDVPEKVRTKAWTSFQDDPSQQLIIVQMHSGGIGIDLFKAQTAIYYTRNWSLEDYLQSQDRLHRIGQEGTVNIIHLMSKLPYQTMDAVNRAGRKVKKRAISIDEAITFALKTKQGLSNEVLGEKFDTEDVEEIIGNVLG